VSLFASLAGLQITRARVTIPWTGIVHADVTISTDLETASQLTGPQSLVIGNLTLAMATYRVIDEVGRIGARLVGGAGGWLKTLPATSYGATTPAVVIGDAAALVGELVGSMPTTALGSYVRSNDVAISVVQDIMGDAWYVDGTGTLQQGARTPTTISSNFQAEKIMGAPGRYMIATESVADWMPGASFANDVVSGTVGRAMIALDQTKVRVEVLVTP
jgi:hypothetical protein